ncbi:MAG: hypothetical protein KAU44_02085, partial [Candidatus Marinimicrobia bacterium]|nr:hypothetical protein [Candidatus Neomarinimicrobiota bacterium]
ENEEEVNGDCTKSFESQFSLDNYKNIMHIYVIYVIYAQIWNFYLYAAIKWHEKNLLLLYTGSTSFGADVCTGKFLC